MIHYGSNLLDLIFQDFYLFQLKLHCAIFILTVTALEDLTQQRFFFLCFGCSQSWIFPFGLGLLRTRGGWTRWPPGLFQPKLFCDSNCLLMFFNTTALSPWFELVSELLLVHAVSLNMCSWNKKKPEITELICRSCCRKICLLPFFF